MNELSFNLLFQPNQIKIMMELFIYPPVFSYNNPLQLNLISIILFLFIHSV